MYLSKQKGWTTFLCLIKKTFIRVLKVLKAPEITGSAYKNV